MHSWCVAGDPICNSTATTNGVDFLHYLPLPLLKRDGPHESCKNTYAKPSGEQMARWLTGHYGMH